MLGFALAVKEEPYLESITKFEWKILSGAEFHIPYLRREGKFRGHFCTAIATRNKLIL